MHLAACSERVHVGLTTELLLDFTSPLVSQEEECPENDSRKNKDAYYYTNRDSNLAGTTTTCVWCRRGGTGSRFDDGTDLLGSLAFSCWR